jgi:hypothetical protein
MASLSSTIFLGSFHPNDGDLVPTHAIEIYEGGSITLSIRELQPTAGTRLLTQVAPHEVMSALLYLTATTLGDSDTTHISAPSSTDFSTLDGGEVSKQVEKARTLHLGLLATLLPGATLQRDELIAIESFEMQICELTYARMFNQWKGRVEVLDYSLAERQGFSN